MKKLYIPLILILSSVVKLEAQFTEGGSTKSYEKYRYKVDTIVTSRTITNSSSLPQRRQAYFYFSVGVLAPLASSFTAEPDPNSTLQDSYTGQDGMGGSTGGSFSIGGFYAFKKLNNKLIPLIDVGIGQNHTLGIHPYNWKSVNSFYESDVKFRPFLSFNSTIAPMAVINPLWKGKNKLHIDVGYKLGVGVVFGGGQVYTPYGYTYDIYRSDAGIVKPHFTHGPTIRVRYSVLMVGFEFNFLKDKTIDAYEYNIDSNSGTFDSNTNLNNFTFNLGVAF